ncbi:MULTISPECIES: DASS family sodium-coupled anion symporter [unclassified Colwellia]|jgi:sodium-dependent dicarboxylate transporter 2/3/5|uniref:SLC13 family permease n=1 Tax=unclassified Colwellia TaxID=196834 RepID=UPI0015F3E0C5|nr:MULTISPECIES: SLC13 family permease [unclassified Colwellia]MBA6336228.1 SLC13/DASS family transporter [Colwellia sp. BRX8-7]MBA6349302.1 SLC13/DASS family transporter [Colwellia sp. BRX8-9]MBA6356472.1 SLC13/DASS family transporter [Colwellia sp. BRX8-3]MBA6361718.1 SLC13/DASS family transporter [Colwellia sp. BRX8-6]MBA6368618.1 SLC13/DASS family transporter [Colwellia sp. BRX8-5]
MKLTKQSFIVLAPALAFGFYFLLLWLGLAEKPATAAAITLLTVIWWVSEAIPIPATSLVPFALLPLLGVVDHKTVASSLGSHVILLLMGAFMLSKAIEKSGAHQRLAVYMVKLVGVSSGRRLVFGFMLASALLSMWISNTATTLIMLPIALAILTHVDNKELKVALILGIAYAASVGGIGTPIGTPPNVIFMGIYEENTGREFGFLSWMKIGVPIVLIALPIMAFWLTRKVKLDHEIKLPAQGEWRSEEKRTLWVFGLTALAWITRSEPFGGWSDLLNVQIAGDSTVALFAVVLMFLIPNGKGSRLLDWDTAKSIPWGMLLLFAGGIAIAKGFVESGLSQILGEWLSSLANLPVIVMILTICLVVTYLTEITSNTATATLLMPILAVVATSAGYDPMVLMVPAAMCASCAFMLPVATAPNAIAYGTGELEIKDMVKEGAILSFILSCLIAIVCYLFLL